MPWLQVTFATDRARAPLVEIALGVADALAIILTDAGDDSRLEPPPGATPLWSEVLVTGLFPGDPHTRARAERLAESLTGQFEGRPRIEYLEDRTWERAWLDDFGPRQFGQRLWVSRRGQSQSVPGAAVVQLDPGLAFGTGNHATTALCLRWLDGAELAGKQVIDYGCGSGILAIAALRLGAGGAVAIDHDPQALEATRENALENGVANRLAAQLPEPQPPKPADVLLANILAGPLIELAPRLGDLVRPEGDLVLSGILEEQADAVAAAYEPAFQLERRWTEEGWVLMPARRKPSCL
ncbi:MAG: 50S ribosomal protein L11 methyltransferase [Chromatiaceae bacterium]